MKLAYGKLNAMFGTYDFDNEFFADVSGRGEILTRNIGVINWNLPRYIIVAAEILSGFRR